MALRPCTCGHDWTQHIDYCAHCKCGIFNAVNTEVRMTSKEIEITFSTSERNLLLHMLRRQLNHDMPIEVRDMVLSIHDKLKGRAL